MTNTVALWLAIVLTVAIVGDLARNGGEALWFLTRRFLDLIEWVAFWR